jgi:hypothetical protein
VLKLKNLPDKIFSAVLDDLFRESLDFLCEVLDEEDWDSYRAILPQTAGRFPARAAQDMLRHLKKAHECSRLWRPRAEHIRMLRELLKFYCDCCNDLSQETSEPILSVDTAEIQRLDFARICALYFEETEEEEALPFAPFSWSPENTTTQRFFALSDPLSTLLDLEIPGSEFALELVSDALHEPGPPAPFVFRRGLREYPSNPSVRFDPYFNV